MGSDLTCLPVLSLSFLWSYGLVIPGVSRPQNLSRPYNMPTPRTLLYGPREVLVLAFEIQGYLAHKEAQPPQTL